MFRWRNYYCFVTPIINTNMQGILLDGFERGISIHEFISSQFQEIKPS